MIYDRQTFNFCVAESIGYLLLFILHTLTPEHEECSILSSILWFGHLPDKPLIHLEFILVPGGVVKSNLPILSSANLPSPAASCLRMLPYLMPAS